MPKNPSDEVEPVAIGPYAGIEKFTHPGFSFETPGTSATFDKLPFEKSPQ